MEGKSKVRRLCPGLSLYCSFWHRYTLHPSFPVLNLSRSTRNGGAHIGLQFVKFISEGTDISEYHSGVNLLTSLSLRLLFLLWADPSPCEFVRVADGHGISAGIFHAESTAPAEGCRLSRNSLDKGNMLPKALGSCFDPHPNRALVPTARRNSSGTANLLRFIWAIG